MDEMKFLTKQREFEYFSKVNNALKNNVQRRLLVDLPVLLGFASQGHGINYVLSLLIINFNA